MGRHVSLHRELLGAAGNWEWARSEQLSPLPHSKPLQPGEHCQVRACRWAMRGGSRFWLPALPTGPFFSLCQSSEHLRAKLESEKLRVACQASSSQTLPRSMSKGAGVSALPALTSPRVSCFQARPRWRCL